MSIVHLRKRKGNGSNEYMYDIIKEIALHETMTIKDLMFAIFQLAIERYKQKNGKVIIRSEQKSVPGYVYRIL